MLPPERSRGDPPADPLRPHRAGPRRAPPRRADRSRRAGPGRRRRRPSRPRQGVTRLEYLFSAALLRILGWLFARLPARPDTVVLASPRKAELDGNLLHIHGRSARPDPACAASVSLEPYSYGFSGQVPLRAPADPGDVPPPNRLAGRGRQRLAAGPRRAAPGGTTVVQVWHAVGALKRFGRGHGAAAAEPERSFLHRHYDWVVSSGEASREPWSTGPPDAARSGPRRSARRGPTCS